MKQFENIEATVIIKPEEVANVTSFLELVEAHRAKIQNMTNDDLPF
jgi:hypothetical protein